MLSLRTAPLALLLVLDEDLWTPCWMSRSFRRPRAADSAPLSAFGHVCRDREYVKHLLWASNLPTCRDSLERRIQLAVREILRFTPRTGRRIGAFCIAFELVDASARLSVVGCWGCTLFCLQLVQLFALPGGSSDGAEGLSGNWASSSISKKVYRGFQLSLQLMRSMRCPKVSSTRAVCVVLVLST